MELQTHLYVRNVVPLIKDDQVNGLYGLLRLSLYSIVQLLSSSAASFITKCQTYQSLLNSTKPVVKAKLAYASTQITHLDREFLLRTVP